LKRVLKASAFDLLAVTGQLQMLPQPEEKTPENFGTKAFHVL